MANPFVAEIRIFGCNFAPKGWAMCDGQILPISQNTALFSLLGTTYGGNGTSTFALPDLQGSLAVHQGQGSGLQEWFLGQTQGEEAVVLLQSEIPFHVHSLVTTSSNATQTSAAPISPAVVPTQLAKGFKGNLQSSNTAPMYSSAAPNQPMSPTALAMAGGDVPHNNKMPYLTLNYCIALQGVFPARN